jgi:hypothetical protein
MVLQVAHNAHPNDTEILCALVAFHRDARNDAQAAQFAQKTQKIHSGQQSWPKLFLGRRLDGVGSTVSIACRLQQWNRRSVRFPGLRPVTNPLQSLLGRIFNGSVLISYPADTTHSCRAGSVPVNGCSVTRTDCCDGNPLRRIGDEQQLTVYSATVCCSVPKLPLGL